MTVKAELLITIGTAIESTSRNPPGENLFFINTLLKGKTLQPKLKATDGPTAIAMPNSTSAA